MASKLQEMLAARKAEQNGKVSSSQVVQSQAVQAAPQKQEQKTAKPSVLDRLKAKPAVNGQSVERSSDDKGGTQEIVPNVSEQGPVVVEETMPEGLSLLQKRKWIAEHARGIPKTSENTDLHKPVLLEETSSQVPIATSETKITSASQSADAQKTNDGQVNVVELKSNLKYLADNIENPELVKDVVRTIAMQIAQRPELAKHMLRGEVNLMVRGLRQSYNQAAMKKQEKSVGKKKVDKDVSELEDMMKGMGVSFKLK